jgi:hypothetical protein
MQIEKDKNDDKSRDRGGDGPPRQVRLQVLAGRGAAGRPHHVLPEIAHVVQSRSGTLPLSPQQDGA